MIAGLAEPLEFELEFSVEAAWHRYLLEIQGLPADVYEQWEEWAWQRLKRRLDRAEARRLGIRMVA